MQQLTLRHKLENKMKNYILMFACITLLASCKVTQKTAVTAPVEDIGVHQYPTVADLKVKPEKVSKTEEWNFVPFNIGQPTLNIRKGNMIAEMVNENGGDILLEPQMQYNKRLFGKRTLTISGFVASFDNFRKASDEDLKALAIGYKDCDKPVYNVARKKPLLSKKAEDEPAEKAEKPQKKNSFRISAGLSSSSLKGYDDNNGRIQGYAVNFEYQRHMPCKLYYAASIGMTNRGFRDSNLSLRSDVVNLVPVGFGYEYEFGKKFAAFAHIGWFMDFYLNDAVKSHNYYSYLNDKDVIDTGIRYGIGIKYGRVSLELMNHNSLKSRYNSDDSYYDQQLNHHQKSLVLALGYNF